MYMEDAHLSCSIQECKDGQWVSYCDNIGVFGLGQYLDSALSKSPNYRIVDKHGNPANNPHALLDAINRGEDISHLVPQSDD